MIYCIVPPNKSGVDMGLFTRIYVHTVRRKSYSRKVRMCQDVVYNMYMYSTVVRYGSM